MGNDANSGYTHDFGSGQDMMNVFYHLFFFLPQTHPDGHRQLAVQVGQLSIVRAFGQIQNKSLYVRLGIFEIYQQSYFHSSCLKIVEQLGFMNLLELIYGL
jgi:hypothetical protein